MELQDQVRKILQKELKSRKAKNPRYSIRNLARKVEIDFSLLSKFLKGEKNLGIKNILKIRKKLKLESALSIEKVISVKPSKKVKSLHIQDKETFQEWYYYLLLEYVDTKSQFPPLKKTAERIGISIQDLEKALLHLTKAGIFKIQEDGRIQVLSENIVNFNDSDNTKRTHRGFLQQAFCALEKWPKTTMSVHSLVIAIDSSEFPLYVREFRKFTAKINEMSMATDKKKRDKIFSLAMTFAPLLDLES